MTNNSKIAAIIAASLLAGAGGAFAIGSLTGSSATEESAGDAHAGHGHASDDSGEADSYYTCPMHPTVISDSPGACPVCGMDLIKKTKSGGVDADPQELAALGRVALSPTQRVLANVQTVEVQPMDVDQEIRAVGIVAYDETGLSTIPAWIPGRIERLHIKETGATVKRGQPVMAIYSEPLVAAQEEFLVALDSGAYGEQLRKQTRRKLRLLGMKPGQIDRVAETGEVQEAVTVYATASGTVTELKVREGQYVAEGAPLYSVADLDTVWIDAEVYERHLKAIDEGMKVRLETDAFPDEELTGEVTFIHPVTDPQSRTTKVRIELDNPDGKLKPGMYATAFFKNGGKGDEAGGQDPVELVVPRSAVIRKGKSAAAFVEVEDNVFERRDLDVGRVTDERIVVRSGLSAGDYVAYQGGFLLDSEVQLNSFGGSGGHGGSGEDGAAGEAVTELTHADIPPGGKEFEPPIPSEAVPEGAWYCDMNDTAHWVQHEKGDGECPVCGMFLKEKGAADVEHAEHTEEAK